MSYHHEMLLVVPDARAGKTNLEPVKLLQSKSLQPYSANWQQAFAPMEKARTSGDVAGRKETL